MAALITGLGWILFLAIAALILIAILFIHFWLFKQYCKIFADAIGDKIMEVVEEFKESKQAPEVYEEMDIDEFTE